MGLCRPLSWTLPDSARHATSVTRRLPLGATDKMKRGLTVRAIEAIQPPAARREIADRYLPGLYLVVQPVTGAKSWAVRYRHNSTTRKLTLGAYPAIDLKAAREL